MSIKKVTQHPTQNEALIFERSQTGRVGYRLPRLDVDETNIDDILPAELRRDDDLDDLLRCAVEAGARRGVDVIAASEGLVVDVA